MTRTMKKFTGFVLMVCMIVSLFAGVTTAFAAKDFKDVSSGNWAKPYVDFVVDKGYFAGATADLFKPDDNMTRGMFVAVIAKVEGLTLDSNVAVDFKDVQPGKYYAGAVKWATDNGIVSGYGNGSFGPNDAITREQICVMMDKYIQYHDANNDTKYLDRKASVDFKDASDISSWAKDSVQKCVSYGLVQGFPDGKFYPKRNATRAEVAVMIYRLALWKEVVDGDEYKVSYKYVSGTEGAELPAALNILIVPDSRTFHTGDIAEAYDPALSTFFADGKQWKFEGYKEKTVTVADADVEFVGVWVVESETQKAYSVKYVYADIDGKTAVPVEAPKDEKTYKTGDKVTASAPESPVKTDNGTWTFVGWDKEGAQSKTETVADHDVVFTGYWKYSAKKFHVTYVAKMYGTGEDLPAEVAKELEGRCPVDKNEYEDGAWVWIKEPTSKSDYNDDTGRAWNYRGSSYSIATTIKGADIEVVEYWGYAGVPFVLEYSNSYEDVGKTSDMSAADRRNVDKALPQPKIQTHYAGETFTIDYPTALRVSKAENTLIFIPLYDADGEWVFQYYEDTTTGKKYYPDKDKTFRMPTDSVFLVGHWQYFPYVDTINYKNVLSNAENNKLLPKPAKQTGKVKYAPGDTVTIQVPSKDTVTANKKTYIYIGATTVAPTSDPEDERLISGNTFTLEAKDINSNNEIDIYWNWIEKPEDKYSVKYEFYTKNGTLPAGIQKLKPEDEKDMYSDGTVVTAKDPKDFTYAVDGTTWIWHKWEVNGTKQDYSKINGKDVVFRGEWSATKTLTATFRFVSTGQKALDPEVVALLGDDVPYAKINLTADKDFDLPTVPAEVKVDGGKWVFKGWESKVATVNNEKNTAKTKKNAEIIGNWEYVPN